MYVGLLGSLIPLKEGGLVMLSPGLERPVLPGPVIFMAFEMAATKAVAVEKRDAGFLARLRIMTPVSAGVM
jgi:hypothetical protein